MTCLKKLLTGTALFTLLTIQAMAAEPSVQRFVGAQPEVFKDPDAALQALKQGLETKNVDGLAKILGLNPEQAKASDDLDERLTELQKATGERIKMDDRDDGAKEVVIGSLVWPFPFPLVKHGGGWQFDTIAGLEEIMARRIGENELEVIKTLRNEIVAQNLYADEDRDDDGVLEFAQQIMSDKGARNGLYWDAEDGEVSPAGNFTETERLEGRADSDQGYFGYRFRMLKSQGSNIAGGRYDFVINGNMIAGHAMIAWPAIYGETGVKTFVVSHHGSVFEKDLGPGTAKAVKEIRSFNPDKSWEPADE